MNSLHQPYQLCSPVATDGFTLTVVALRRPTWEDRKSIRQIIRAETKRTGRRPCLLTVERTIVCVLSGLTMQQVRRIAPIDLAHLNAKSRAALGGKGLSS